jgi:hypothetical protein
MINENPLSINGSKSITNKRYLHFFKKIPNSDASDEVAKQKRSGMNRLPI